MKTKPFSLLLFSVIALFGVAPDRPGFGQDQTKPVLKKEAKTDKAGAESGANPAAAAQKSASADPEERFKALFTKATLSGRSAPLTDGVLGEEKTGDKYSIVSATKGSGDAWTVNARMKYRDQEMIIPVPVQMKFVGDVAILEVNNLMIPDGGTYTARLMIYDRTYSGTWKGPRGGGMIYGTITNERE